jgi:hypothetical protein
MRDKLPDRRLSVNMKIDFETGSGAHIPLQVTFGFDEAGHVREVFCADFKSGSDNHAVVMDSCVLLSRLLQHGTDPDQLAASLCTPPSLIGTIAAAVARMNREWR